MIKLDYLLEIGTNVLSEIATDEEGTEQVDTSVDTGTDTTENTDITETSDEVGQEETFFDIDGEKYTPAQIKEWKQGHLRQSDYTKKTQEIANMRKENQEAIELYEFFKANPHMADELAKLDNSKQNIANSIQNKDVQDLQVKIKALEIDKELELLKVKDNSIDEVEILNIANQKSLPIQDAYNYWRGQNMDKILEKKLAEKSAQITNNIKNNNVISKTLITGADKPVSNFGLSEQQLAMASRLGMTPEEYKKWS